MKKNEMYQLMIHDIRTPIHGIMGMIQIALKNGDNKEKVVECLGKIEDSSKYLLSLVNDILDLSSMENGEMKIRKSRMDVRSVIEYCESVIRSQAEENGITFEVVYEEFINPYVLGDEMHLQQILINILGNAIKFTPEGGKITFYIEEKQNGNYYFEITDTGIGMKEEFLKQIWEPFAQEKEEYIAQKGNGIGMAITKQLVDLLGGSILAESRLHQGSKFMVQIPFELSEEILISKEKKPDVTGMQILLAEDNALNREITKSILEEEGALITMAENGQMAVSLFQESLPKTYDLILMDIMMPIMNGFEAAKKIRSLERSDAKEIPILAMTADVYEESEIETKKAQITEHLTKPIDACKVLSAVSKYKRCHYVG